MRHRPIDTYLCGTVLVARPTCVSFIAPGSTRPLPSFKEGGGRALHDDSAPLPKDRRGERGCPFSWYSIHADGLFVPPLLWTSADRNGRSAPFFPAFLWPTTSSAEAVAGGGGGDGGGANVAKAPRRRQPRQGVRSKCSLRIRIMHLHEIGQAR